MAFYNDNMSKNKLLRKAWKVAHFNQFDGEEEVNLPEICNEIGKCMWRSRRPRSRQSLRSLSFLVSGAARILKKQVDDLLKDCIYSGTTKLDVQNSGLGSDSESTASDSESMEIDTSPIESVPDIEESINDGHESTACTVTPEQTVIDKQETIKGTDEIAQTSAPPTSEDRIPAFDSNLPFGYIPVHDNY